VFGRRKDAVFLRLQELLEPFGITKYDTDGWGAYALGIKLTRSGYDDRLFMYHRDIPSM
jgi:IS1 family transposase